MTFDVIESGDERERGEVEESFVPGRQAAAEDLSLRLSEAESASGGRSDRDAGLVLPQQQSSQIMRELGGWVAHSFSSAGGAFDRSGKAEAMRYAPPV